MPIGRPPVLTLSASLLPATRSGDLLPRGVVQARYTLQGAPVLLATDSRGECIHQIRLAEDELFEMCEEVATAWLEGLLDHYDPVPRRPTLGVC